MHHIMQWVKYSKIKMIQMVFVYMYRQRKH
jgi:hypothetical protein